MRVFVTFLFLVFFGFYSTNSHSQNTVIKIEADAQLNIEQIFELIQSKTEYQFIYRHDLVKDAPKIKVGKGVIKVKDILKKILPSINCKYEFKDNRTIIVKNNGPLKFRKDNQHITPSNKSSTLVATLLDRQTNDPIIFANIGFIRKGVGTISNETGYFKLTFNTTFLNTEEVLQISTLGYETLQLNAKQLSKLILNPSTLYLNPEPLALSEVVITNTKRKEVRLGNTRFNKKTNGYWKNKEALGGEIASKLKIRKENTKLLDLKFNVVKNLSDSIKIRINMYDYNKRYPSKKLLNKNIFHVIKKKTGIVSIDLRPYNITVDNDVVVSLELIKVYGDRIDFAVSAEPHIGVGFRRYVSQDKWKRYDYVGMNFSVLTSIPLNTSKNKVEISENENSLSLNNTDDILKKSNTINGIITSMGQPLQNIDVIVKDSNRSTKTDINGHYQINANVGEVIEYKHLDYKTISIIVEDITKTLNLEMSNDINELDEITLQLEENIEHHKIQDYYNDDNTSQINETGYAVPNLNNKTISGIVTHINGTLENATVKIKNSSIGTKTDANGYYKIKAKIGDIIEFSYVGYQTVSIIVEDVTSKINIDMVTYTNKLDEVTVTAKPKNTKILERAKKKEKIANTARGTIDPKRMGYKIPFIDGKEISAGYPNLTTAIVGNAPSAKIHRATGRLMVSVFATQTFPEFPIWDIDGQIFDEEPPINLISNLESIHILRSSAATTKYGSRAAGGVIIVNTKANPLNSEKNASKKIGNKLINNNFYNNDAVDIDLKTSQSVTPYAQKLTSMNDVEKAYNHYNSFLKKRIKEYDIHLELAETFIHFYNNKKYGFQILKELAKTHNKNPEILKAIAYYYQIIGSKNEAVKTYKTIHTLRPRYAQSYRDLGNAFVENDQFKKAWRAYMNYIIQEDDIEGEGIGPLLYSEMEYLYFNRANQTKIKEQFIPKNKTKTEFRNDIRLVIEWNTSEAEFDLEFVGPERRTYTFEHSLSKSEFMIIDEKTKGYSSREFIINDVNIHDWLVNITYEGNKKSDPTYFKITTYYHWGKPTQRQVVNVYKFQNERHKIQLLKINKELLVASK